MFIIQQVPRPFGNCFLAGLSHKVNKEPRTRTSGPPMMCVEPRTFVASPLSCLFWRPFCPLVSGKNLYVLAAKLKLAPWLYYLLARAK